VIGPRELLTGWGARRVQLLGSWPRRYSVGGRVTWVPVRVVCHGQLLEGPLDLCFVCRPGHLKDVVEGPAACARGTAPAGCRAGCQLGYLERRSRRRQRARTRPPACARRAPGPGPGTSTDQPSRAPPSPPLLTPRRANAHLATACSPRTAAYKRSERRGVMGGGRAGPRTQGRVAGLPPPACWERDALRVGSCFT